MLGVTPPAARRPDPTTPSVRWRHLRTEEVFLVVPSSHRFVGEASVPLRQLAQEETVLGKPGDVLREIVGGYFRQAGFAPRVAVEADEPAAVEDYVAAGLGVAFIPGLSKPLPTHAMTPWVRITEPVCRLTVGIAWNETRHLSQAARAFRSPAIACFDDAGAGGRGTGSDAIVLTRVPTAPLFPAHPTRRSARPTPPGGHSNSDPRVGQTRRVPMPAPPMNSADDGRRATPSSAIGTDNGRGRRSRGR